MTLAAVNPTDPARKEFATTWSLRISAGVGAQCGRQHQEVLIVITALEARKSIAQLPACRVMWEVAVLLQQCGHVTSQPCGTGTPGCASWRASASCPVCHPRHGPSPPSPVVKVGNSQSKVPEVPHGAHERSAKGSRHCHAVPVQHWPLLCQALRQHVAQTPLRSIG